MFSAPPQVANSPYRLTGRLDMSRLSADGLLTFMPGAFEHCSGQAFPLWIGHNERTGCMCTLTERGGELRIEADLDPVQRIDSRLIRLALDGRISGFSPSGRLTCDRRDPHSIVAYYPREISLCTWPRRPRFQSEVRIERI